MKTRLLPTLVALVVVPATARAQAAWTTPVAPPEPAPSPAALPPPPPPAALGAALDAVDEPAELEFRGGRLYRRTVRYRGGPVPPHARLEHRPNVDTARVGAELVLAAYVPSALLGALCVSTAGCTQNGLGWLLVPGPGPLVAMFYPQSPEGYAALVADALVQGIGLALVVVGLASGTTAYLVEQYAGRSRRPARWGVAAGPRGVALSLSGD